MTKWIFLKDYDVVNDFDQAINLDFVMHFDLRIKDKQLVLFFSGKSADPHLLSFQDAAGCQNAYDSLKTMLQPRLPSLCKCCQV